MGHSRNRRIYRQKRELRRAVVAFALAVFWATGAAFAQSDAPAAGAKLVVPMIDVGKGKRLFVERGCVLCHMVNKVGGRAGPPLDAPAAGRPVDLLDFMARMWRGAFAMIELQGMELGYQLDFSGQDLGHIAAFLADRSAQEAFSERDVPDLIQDMFIREPFDLTTGLRAPGER